MGEPGKEGQGEDLTASPLLEGEAVVPGGAAQRESVPPFRGQAKPAASLDMLADMDEPEQLIRELKDVALSHGTSDRRWKGIVALCDRAMEYFEFVNKPNVNRPQP